VLATLTLDAAPPSPPLDFNLRDPAGRTYRLADWRDRPVVVVVFLGVDCPLAKLYAPRLIELSKRHPRRTAFAAVFPNQHDTVRDVARYAREHAVPFPALRDVGNVVADRFDARRSPEVFVLDQARRVRYRGRIDDQYSVGIHRPRATSHELADAVESLLAGKPVRVAETTPPGCPISRVKKNTVRDHSVTYCRDVAPILARRCVACHRPGQSAPFALTSHAAASGWAGAIREVIEERRMPPRGADPAHGTFANEPSLTPAEKDTLFRWIDAGCPEGDRRHLPPPPTFPEGWTIPRPNLVLSMPVEFEVPAEGVIEYQHFRVDPGFKEDRWVTAAEIMPGNRSVVHHCNIFLQPPGIDDPEYLAEAGKLGSYCLTMIAQGTPPMRLPPGMAKRIPAGWRIVFVMHYQAVGSRQKDRTRLALTFADPNSWSAKYDAWTKEWNRIANGG
jgi:peroxiredoxin